MPRSLSKLAWLVNTPHRLIVTTFAIAAMALWLQIFTLLLSVR